jgi:hypothetical protein
LVLVAGDDLRSALDAALPRFELPTGEQVTLAVADRDLVEAASAPGSLLLSLLRLRGFHAKLAVPASTTAGAWFRARATEWRAIEARGLDRLERVWIADSIASASSLAALNRLPANAEKRGALAIGLWARFAHPRQRTGAWLSNPRDGLTAEIAAAVSPLMIVLTGEWKGFALALLSDDLIAAELGGLGVLQALTRHGDELNGPWEDPLVQHATELGIGVRQPAQIAGEVIWAGAHSGSAAETFPEFGTNVLARLGVNPNI